MEILYNFLKQFGEFQISSLNEVLKESEKYKLIDDCLECDNLYKYENEVYNKKITTFDYNNKSYKVIQFINITKYINEMEKLRKDILTNLPNRAEISRYISCKNDEAIIVMCDIDDFKKVNDEHGHQVGDEVLKMFGEVIKSELYPCDFAGRYGGEEFLLIFKDLDIVKVKERVDNINKKFNTKSLNLNLTISSGIHKFNPLNETIEQAISKSDKALYYIKQHGKNNSIVYENIFLN